jgi:4a-hydroxytetrahydrobiopterin dehydratase
MKEPRRPRPLSDDDVSRGLAALPGWKRDGDALARTRSFDSFAEAMDFANRVAAEAERADHHPDIIISYRRVTLRLTSHDAGGITDRDLRLAGRIDAIAQGEDS